MTNPVPYTGRLHPQWRPPVQHLRMPPPAGNLPQTGPERAALQRLRAAAVQERWVRQARRHFPSFMEYVFTDAGTGRPFQQQWFHDEWAAVVDAHTHVLLIAPRSHGKTSFMIGRTVWEIGRNPNTRLKFICAADGRAKERLYEITQLILHNPRVQEVFPELEPAPDSPWNAHRIYVRRPSILKDATVEALGITSTATGGRADVLVPDDVVDRRNALTMPALREQIKQAWLSDWSNLLEPRTGRVWGICTLWHSGDLNHMLRENKTYHTHFLAVPDDLGSLWPDRWPEEALRAKLRELGPVEFARGFFNRPSADEGQIIQSTWIHYADLSADVDFQQRQGGMQWFTSYDPASAPTGNRGQDYTAGVMIAVDGPARKVYVVDCWHARLTLHQAAERVAEDFERLRPVYRAVVEKVGQSALHEEVLEHHPAVRPFLETATPTVSKAARLLTVSPLLEAGHVIFSAHLDPDAPAWMPGRENLVHELLDFGLCAHDDCADAFSQALYWARRYVLDQRYKTPDNGTMEVRVRTPQTDGSATPYLF